MTKKCRSSPVLLPLLSLLPLLLFVLATIAWIPRFAQGDDIDHHRSHHHHHEHQQYRHRHEPADSRRLWLLTVASHETGALANLRASAAFHGVAFRQLGNGTRFTRTGLKLELFMDALVGADAEAAAFDDRIADDDLVLCADGYDVMLHADRAELIKAYDQLGYPIVLAGERGCWPQHFCTEIGSVQYDFEHAARVPYPFVNSGLVMGTAEALRATIGEMLQYPVFEDQEAWTRFYLTHQASRQVTVDDRGAIFLCLTLHNASTELRFAADYGRWINLNTMTTPLVLHGNGDEGIANLIWMAEEHPPPFPLNATAWRKNISMPMKERDQWWIASDPDALAPRAGGPLDLINFYYNQGAMAVRSGDLELAKRSLSHVYGLYSRTESRMSESQKSVILQALERNALKLFHGIDESDDDGDER
jgi:hypothetical protein